MKEEICFVLKVHFSSEQKEVDKLSIFLSNNRQTKNDEIGVGGAEIFQGVAKRGFFYIKNKI